MVGLFRASVQYQGICLSEIFAALGACLFILKIIHPAVLKFIESLPGTLSTILCIIFLAAVAADFTVTLINVLKLPKKLRTIAELEKALTSVSENLGERLSARAISLNSRAEELKTNQEAEREALREKYNRLTAKPNFVQRRIIKAFPNIKKGRYQKTLEKLFKKTPRKKDRKSASETSEQ